MPSHDADSAIYKVVHTTCARCGAFNEYDGTTAMSLLQLRALHASFCPRCGARGHTIIGMVSYTRPVRYPLRKLPRSHLQSIGSAALFRDSEDFRKGSGGSIGP
jgi:ribosomal protein S27AE